MLKNRMGLFSYILRSYLTRLALISFNFLYLFHDFDSAVYLVVGNGRI